MVADLPPWSGLNVSKAMPETWTGRECGKTADEAAASDGTRMRQGQTVDVAAVTASTGTNCEHGPVSDWTHTLIDHALTVTTEMMTAFAGIVCGRVPCLKCLYRVGFLGGN